MLTLSAIAAILGVAPAILAAPAPAPQVTEPASFGPDIQVSYQAQSTVGPDYPLAEELGDGYTSATYHGPYTGTPTTTGAVEGPTTLAASIAPLPLNPTATYYNTGGKPINPFPAPYTPAGGLGTNGTLPRYMVNSDFDYESIALGLYQVRFPRALYSRSFADIKYRNGSSSTSSMTGLPAFLKPNFSRLASLPSTCPSSNSWPIKKPDTRPF